MLQHAVQAFLIAAVLSPFSYYAGLAANRLRLPQITGYLISGIICGPYGLALLSQESVSDLNIIEGACLGIIGIAAGAELHLSELNKFKKQVVSLTTAICVLTWLLCYSTFSWATSSSSPLMLHQGMGAGAAAVASLGATIMMARSPASAIAVLKEMDAKGPFSGLIMGVVVLKDVMVIVAFAINMELVAMVSQSSGGAGQLGPVALLLPLLSVCVSVSAGCLGGYMISLGMQYQVYHYLTPALGGAAGGGVPVLRAKILWVLLLTTSLFQGVRALDAEPLLACVTAGMLVANRRTERDHEEMGALINTIMSYSNVAFFGLAGAALKLSAIADSVVVALLVVLVRLLAIWAGSWAGSLAGGLKGDHQRLFWLGMVTQAGVAMGLARIAGTRFTDWGPHFQTLMMAIIMINMLIGPPMFRQALIQVGEARVGSLPSHHRERERSVDKLQDKDKEESEEHVGGSGVYQVATAGHLRSVGMDRLLVRQPSDDYNGVRRQGQLEQRE